MQIHENMSNLLFELFSSPRSIVDVPLSALKVNAFGFFENINESTYKSISATLTGLSVMSTNISSGGNGIFSLEQLLVVTGTPLTIGSVNCGSTKHPAFTYAFDTSQNTFGRQQVEFSKGERFLVSCKFDFNDFDIHPNLRDRLVEIFRDGEFSGSGGLVSTLPLLPTDMVAYPNQENAFENSGTAFNAIGFTDSLGIERISPFTINYRQGLTSSTQISIGSIGLGSNKNANSLIFDDVYVSKNANQVWGSIDQLKMKPDDILEVTFKMNFRGKERDI